jgi:type IV pilus assembly protein PilE
LITARQVIVNGENVVSYKEKQNGFSLIELMIVVLIIGILAGIAIPSYSSYMERARRADGKAALTSFANAMERYYTEKYTYLNAGTTANTNGDANSAGAPTIFPTEAPLDGGTKYYDLTINDSTATTYILRATPKGAQSGDGYLELLSTGQRRWDRNDDGDTNDTVNGVAENSGWD